MQTLNTLEGKGTSVWNRAGREHLDCTSGGVWTVNVGYGRERIARRSITSWIKMNYFAGSAGSIPGAIFAEQLIEKMPGMSRVYYMNSGSEANEKSYKMVRRSRINAMAAKSTRCSTATATTTAPPSPASARRPGTSATRNRPLHAGLRARAALPRIPPPRTRGRSGRELRCLGG